MSERQGRYTPTGKERTFSPDEFIVSKTDVHGKITYANDVFLRVSGYTEQEIFGAPHSLVRHPDMPRCVFQLLWDRIRAKGDILAYVKNMSKGGDHYWVLAHVTPTLGNNDELEGFHSNRRLPSQTAVRAIEPVYRELIQVEAKFERPKDSIEAGMAALRGKLGSAKVTYEEFVLSL